MGNVLCRHRDPVSQPTSGSSLRSPFERIISRVQLCPSNLHHGGPDHNKRNCNKCETKLRIPPAELNNKQENCVKKESNLQTTQWYDETDTTSDRNQIKNIFADLIDPKTPVPPPRYNKKQKQIMQMYKDQAPVTEEHIEKTVAKKHICDIDEKRFTKQHVKHHSTVSLPNINELQLSVANDNLINNEINETKLKNNKNKNSKLEMYMTRCRSFGSLLPNKLKLSRAGESKTTGSYVVESDDSWAGLEDWDLRVIEYYKPHDNSLPRQFPPIPVAPQRKTDTLLRKLNKQKQIELPNNRLSLVQANDMVIDAKINDLSTDEPIYESLKSVHNENANLEPITYADAKEAGETIIKEIENEVNKILIKDTPVVKECISKDDSVIRASIRSVDSLNEHSTLLKILSKESLTNDNPTNIRTTVSLYDIFKTPSLDLKDDSRQKYV